MPPPPVAPRPDVNPMAAHSALQRNLLSLLVEIGGQLALPARSSTLLRQTIERFPEVGAVQAMLNPGNVERALHELQGCARHALRASACLACGSAPRPLVARALSLARSPSPPSDRSSVNVGATMCSCLLLAAAAAVVVVRCGCRCWVLTLGAAGCCCMGAGWRRTRSVSSAAS
jgi:hypothetical protein